MKGIPQPRLLHKWEMGLYKSLLSKHSGHHYTGINRMPAGVFDRLCAICSTKCSKFITFKSQGSTRTRFGEIDRLDYEFSSVSVNIGIQIYPHGSIQNLRIHDQDSNVETHPYSTDLGANFFVVKQKRCMGKWSRWLLDDHQTTPNCKVEPNSITHWEFGVK